MHVLDVDAYNKTCCKKNSAKNGKQRKCKKWSLSQPAKSTEQRWYPFPNPSARHQLTLSDNWWAATALCGCLLTSKISLVLTMPTHRGMARLSNNKLNTGQWQLKCNCTQSRLWLGTATVRCWTCACEVAGSTPCLVVFNWLVTTWVGDCLSVGRQTISVCNQHLGQLSLPSFWCMANRVPTGLSG